MEGFDFDIELGDWSLQAIVKGCTNTSDHIITMQNTTGEDYTRHGNESVEHLNIVNSGIDQSIHNRANVNPTRVKKEKGASVSLANSKEIFKTRRRKNKYEMNVVQQVAEDRVFSDKWNWRKYGQKTIKGSPYPRNYYKCSSSSSGGCKARKQVEHSSTNPGNLLIAYIHEHNHPYPTRRHSQAGRAKERFQPLPKLATTSSSLESSSFGDNYNNNTNFQCNNSYKDINVTESLEDVGGGGSVTSMVWDDEFFDGLEYLEGLSQEYVLNPTHVPQESTMFCLDDWEQGRNY